MSEISQAAFSRLAGVSKVAILKAIKSGKLALTKNKKIDDKSPLALSYLRIQLDKSKKSLATETIKAVKLKKTPKTKNKPAKQSKPPKSKIPLNNPEYDEEQQKIIEAVADKELIDAEYKKVQTEKIKISNAEKLKLLVPIDFIKKKFGKISSIILNYFFPMGERLAPIVCGMCGVTDPEKIQEVKNKINDEITRALSEFKKTAAEEIKE
jgi:hypothetical protein